MAVAKVKFIINIIICFIKFINAMVMNGVIIALIASYIFIIKWARR